MNITISILKVIHFFRLIFSKTSEKCVLKIYHLDPVKFISAPGLAWQAALKKTSVKLELLTYIAIVEKGIKGAMYHAIHWYTKVNDKYMKEYNKNEKFSFLKYWDTNQL